MSEAAAMRQVLAELELISHGSTQAWNAQGGGGNDERWAPPGESSPPHITYRRLWNEAADDHARSLVLRDAKAALQAIRGHGVDRSRVVGETREQESKRILTEGEGFTATEVALRFKCTPTRVRRLRLAVGRDAEMGRKSSETLEEEAAEAAAAAEAGAAAEARRMHSKGLSQRQIALVLDRPRRTIRDWLEATAA